jgi:outer membrane protein
VKINTLALPTLVLALGMVSGAQTPVPPPTAAPAQSQAAAAAPAATPAPNSSPIPNKVGVIEIQGAIVGTKDGQKAVAELNARLEPRKKDLERKAAEIRTLQDQLQRGGDKMAQAAKDELTHTIDKKTTSYNRDMQDAQDEAEQEQRKLLDELGQKLMTVIDKYAQTRGFSVILDVSNPNTPVLFASNMVNITKDIIDLYDKSTAGGPATTGAKPAGTPSTPASKPAAPPPATTPAVKKQP